MLFATLGALAGCGDAAGGTYVVVTVDADEEVKAGLTALRLLARAEGREARTEEIAPPITWPVVFGLTPAGGDATQRFRVEARAEGTTAAVASARSGYAEGRTVWIHLHLSGACGECREGETCCEGACTNDALNELLLPSYSAGATPPPSARCGAPTDAGPGARDADVPLDAGRDAGDVGGDAGPTSDGGGPDDDAGPRPDAGAPTGAFVAVAAGNHHSCALSDEGAVWCWGNGAAGQLGPGGSSGVPRRVEGITGGAIRLAVGGQHSCVVREDTSVLCWGNNANGELLLMPGDPPVRSMPAALEGVSSVSALGLGWAHACAIVGDGELVCWGLDDAGQLSEAATGPQCGAICGPPPDRDQPCCWEPIEVPIPSGERVLQVEAGTAFTCAVTESRATSARSLWCWGGNESGQLGVGSAAASIDRVSRVTGVDDPRAIALGRAHACAVQGDGRARCWGQNGSGELGLGRAGGRVDTPELVQHSTGGGTSVGDVPDVRSLTAGATHTCALTLTAELCWGDNANGRLGDETEDRRARPTPIAWSDGTRGTALTAGTNHTCAILSTEQVACWGRNDFGQVGDGRTVDRLSPVTVLP